MKKILVILLIIVFACSLFVLSACEKDKKTVLYVYTESGFPPFEYSKGDEIVGVDIEIAKAIAKELGMELVVRDVMFDSIVSGINEDNAIGLAGITITPDREQAVDFSIPYFGDAIQYVIYPKGALELNDELMIEGDLLKNKVLGVQTGTTGDNIVQVEVKEGGLFAGATAKGYDNALIAADDIGSGCDYVVIDRLTALQIAAANNNLEASQIAGLDAESYGIAVKKGNKVLLNAINWILHNLLEEGKIDQWLEEHSESIEE
ncbi:MAG: transporter substrate-binding domain-containing protein [Bacillota bacterium]|jgi:ABC-type amino acid transport substrate-binding protein|nr:transporter substrate-binding domain-containing protein [Bacillota bacterium]HHU43913.1 transporter substrate-binding domain-containing protein [Clostridiales bacterium]